ncbi:hypothetical protein MYCTH_2305259 [Thermothelomyces thermophilus ATCC 42464]|uniref:Uncharacterized protein n=1 Tax=Thermothelomyces thermophilus (strain ATCC 42464 / BCRC 31852 / DSM 1799) TaxID=573729 RepID=G2QCF3_THET4|nr:uncharacterized protein MYCTH_2305259 [Thermothelomyces thermophilus ATCC 42464]AEO58129.1 hypothetical protein MYCTH_2305259 [Thermothelomyces thermophilus ATCC 42464]
MATINLGRTLTRTAITPTTSPLLRRLRLRRAALPLGFGLGLGLTTGLVAVHHQRPMQFDSLAVPVPSQTRSLASGRSPRRKDLLDAETVKQLSSGSLSGFFAGLLVSVFSKTLVLLAGIGMVLIQVAARNGIDLVATLKLKERASTSRILAMLNQHTAFKLSFAVAFALSAFMSF